MGKPLGVVNRGAIFVHFFIGTPMSDTIKNHLLYYEVKQVYMTLFPTEHIFRQLLVNPILGFLSHFGVFDRL